MVSKYKSGWGSNIPACNAAGFDFRLVCSNAILGLDTFLGRHLREALSMKMWEIRKNVRISKRGHQ